MFGRAHLLRRIEELTYENAALKKDVEYLRNELQRKHKKIGDLICDNGRLIKTNAALAEWKHRKPATRHIDDNGDKITEQ